MIKNIIGGMCIGVANIIPGISGGTVIVLLGFFDKTMKSISDLFKIKISFKERLEAFKFLFQLAVGVAIGLVGFAKVLTYLFEHFENQTLLCFVGMILFSLPTLMNQEMKDKKISLIYLGLGVLLIGTLVYFSSGSNENIVPLADILDKNITIVYALSLIIVGLISGATMIFPGVSGSMVLLVLGWYHLFKGYVANVTSFEPKIIIGLILIAVGVGLGVIFGAKITNYLLGKNKRCTMSFIIGLIIMSSICIIPLKGYDLVTIITSILSFIFGATLVTIYDKKRTKKQA